MVLQSFIRPHPRYGKIGYGFGLQIYQESSLLEYSRSGSIDGYTTTLLYYRLQKISIITLEDEGL